MSEGANEIERNLDRILSQLKFEIELSWKRATYFSVFIAGTYAGFYKIAICSSKHYFLGLLISIFGLALSLLWFLSIKANQFWQKHWEDKILSDWASDFYNSNKPRHSLGKLSLALSIVSGVPFALGFVYILFKLFEKNCCCVCSFDFSCLKPMLILLSFIGLALIWLCTESSGKTK